MSILTEDNTINKKQQQRMAALNRERRKVLFAIDAAKFNWKGYSSSIKKYIGMYTWH